MAKTSSVVGTAVKLAFMAAIVTAALNYQLLLDQYALATYHPKANVAAIESRLGLTNYARGIFYRTNPAIDAKAAFNSDCETTKGELELGCYYRGNIYVLHIDNQSLTSEMDVVTAHELLHAAWARLSAGDKTKLTAELEQAYVGLNDADLRDRMAQYAQSEPGQEANELHSILATETAKLSPELEAYYARYFTNRAQIVAAHEQYQNVFNSRKSELETQLATIRSLKAQLVTLNQQLDTYRSNGSIPAYNALVPRQNSLVDSINSRIDSYQSGVDEYNALSRSLDSQEITDTEAGVGTSH
jgi:hypothetical protein